MIKTLAACPLCQSSLDRQVDLLFTKPKRVSCSNCGNFVVPLEFYSDWIETARLKLRDLATLSYAIRRLQRDGELAPLIVETTAKELLDATTLPNALGQIDNLVLFLGQTLTEPGATIDLIPSNLRAVLGAVSNEGAEWVIDQAIARDLVQAPNGGIFRADMTTSGFADATLSIAGWERFETLLTQVVGSKRAFMAMQFGDAELDRVFRDCFKDAAKRAGFDLMRLDEEPRAGLIDDRLRLELRSSRFVVVDLTHGNMGAYWEAGFAEGLGRPVIYTCKRSVFDDPRTKPHFDTNHYLIVLWDEANLGPAADQLATTIRVTLPVEAKLSD